jgi:hypothetical protein
MRRIAQRWGTYSILLTLVFHSRCLRVDSRLRLSRRLSGTRPKARRALYMPFRRTDFVADIVQFDRDFSPFALSHCFARSISGHRL